MWMKHAFRFHRDSLVLLLGVLLGGTPQAFAAPADTVEAVTIGQPPVSPGEFRGDLSKLPRITGEIGAPHIYRPLLQPPRFTKQPTQSDLPAAAPVGGPLAPMPGPIQSFAGMSRTDLCTGGQCGTGWPPDTTGDVGPNHYIQAVNGSVAIYTKTGGLLASFTENQLWLGVGSSPCNGNSRGDPLVLYDWLADRFVLSWFAFGTGGPYYQCFAASKTSDPVVGGWWLYAVRMDPGGAGLPPVGSLNDYGKMGLWHDCLYLATNEFANAATYNGVAFGSFSRADMYSGAALTYSLGFLGPATNAFTLVPSNSQGKGALAAQPGTPNYFVSESQTLFAFEVRKFTAGPNCGPGGTMSAVTNVTQASYLGSNVGNVVPQPNTSNMLDNIVDRVMQKVQYRTIGGVESLWVTHNVDPTPTQTAMQWAQINVTGGTIVTTPVQQQIHAPDATLNRWMGSLAVDNQGNMALGYSTSNGTAPNFPSIAYAGRLATDPLNTLPQTETQLIAGAGSQTNTCGGNPCHRWGDYSSMSVDPVDDCTFWYTTEYYSSQTNGTAGNWQTRIGSFKFPSCTAPVTLARRKIDFNADGRQDLTWRNSSSGSVSLWLMNGLTNLSFATGVADPSYSITNTGDLNGDGKTDLIWRQTTGATVAWLMNGTAYTSYATLLADPNWSVVRVADFNGDGKEDLLWRNIATGQTAIWLMNGLASSGSAIIFSDPNWQVTNVGDFNADGKADLVWRNTATGQTAVWLMNGLTPTATAVVFSDANWQVTNIGDFNGDGKSDLVWRNIGTGQTAIWLMNGVAAASSAIVFGDPNWQVTNIGDFDGDGRSDLVWRNNTSGQTAVWLMNGTAAASSAVVLADTNWRVTHIADTNGDGMADLVWRNSSTGATVVWLMNGVAYTGFATIMSDPTWVVSPADGL